MLCPNATPIFFVYAMLCHENYMRYESDGNDLKATGGVATFVHCVKCNISDFCC